MAIRSSCVASPPNIVFGDEISVGSGHNFTIGGYDFSTEVVVPDPADPTDTVLLTASGVNVAWVDEAGQIVAAL
jgi:hypothetical protein